MSTYGSYTGGNPSGVSSYTGYPPSAHWNIDSRPIAEATNIIRSFVTQNIVRENQWEIDRITHYYLYWKFYEGLHYKDFNDGMLSFNYIRAFIDKINMFLLGDEAFTFHVKSFYTAQVDKEIEKNAEELMMYHWGKSDKLQLAYEMLQMGGITGDAWVGVNWQEDGKFCKISIYDSRQCFCEFENGDYNKLKSFLIRQMLDSKNGGYRMYVQKWTNETVETWYQDDITIDDKFVSKHEHKTYRNEYGFIPVVHIKNKPNSSGYYGKSDASDILKINKIYNETAQQIKAIIDYHVTPTTVITGASAKSLKKGLGQIWSGLPAEASVFNLGLDVDLSSAMSFMMTLKTAMHELSDVPENALGKIQAISNTSAAALQITYHPLIQQANIKAMTYGEGITKINSMILRILSVKNPNDKRLKKLLSLNSDFLDEMHIVPVFSYGFPKDRLDELNKAQMELSMKIASRREIMERLGKQNIHELLDEIMEDQQMLETMGFDKQGAEGSEKGQGNEPTDGFSDEELDAELNEMSDEELENLGKKLGVE